MKSKFLVFATLLLASEIHADKAAIPPRWQEATFAGGCFWCMEPPFEKLNGVKTVISGFMGGTEVNPSYEKVSAGLTKHTEVVQVTFDANKVSYETLLETFWRNIDPTDSEGQFVDRGAQYRPEVFYHTDEQKLLAEESIKILEQKKIFPKKIVTPVTKAGAFYPAEDYHQDYYKVNPIRYRYYRSGSGRDKYLDSIWKKKSDFKIFDRMPNSQKDSKGGSMIPANQTESKTSPSPWQNFKKPSPAELQKILTPEQFKVTQKDGTERPFNNIYWDKKDAGIYVDVVSKEPLFSSLDKYDSGTGWPSFTKPLESKQIKTKVDKSLFSTRTEVRSVLGDSHLGHVFEDGPKPTGLRYCMNSAALEFIPVDQLEARGYGEYLKLFKK